jgi:hypothetical protein
MMKRPGVVEMMRWLVLVARFFFMAFAKPPAPLVMLRYMPAAHGRRVWRSRGGRGTSRGLLQGSGSMWYCSTWYLRSSLKRWYAFHLWRTLHYRHAGRRRADALAEQGRQSDLQRKWRGCILFHLLPVPTILYRREIACKHGRSIIAGG